MLSGKSSWDPFRVVGLRRAQGVRRRIAAAPAHIGIREGALTVMPFRFDDTDSLAFGFVPSAVT